MNQRWKDHQFLSCILEFCKSSIMEKFFTMQIKEHWPFNNIVLKPDSRVNLR
jgi:hypothetical protein